MSLTSKVVLPAPLQPAIPITRMMQSHLTRKGPGALGTGPHCLAGIGYGENYSAATMPFGMLAFLASSSLTQSE